MLTSSGLPTNNTIRWQDAKEPETWKIKPVRILNVIKPQPDSTEFLLKYLKCRRAIFPPRTRPYPEAAVPSVIQKSAHRGCFLHWDHEAARRQKQHIDQHIDHEGDVHHVSCASCCLQMRHHHPSPAGKQKLPSLCQGSSHRVQSKTKPGAILNSKHVS